MTTAEQLAALLRQDRIPEQHSGTVLPPAQLAGRIQHTLLGQAITDRQVRTHVQECLEFGFDLAVVPPTWVATAKEEFGDNGGRVGSFLDYPFGTGTTTARVAEAKALVQAGVDELDTTIKLGFLLSGRIREFTSDLSAVVAAASPIGVKAVLELPLLGREQQLVATRAAADAGVAFVGNASSGSIGIADAGTIAFLRGCMPSSIGVKASGGIKTVEQVRAVLLAGADLIGTAAGVPIVTGCGRVPGTLYSY